MLNQIVLVGRVQDLKQEQENATMTIEVKRSYKNINGEYESDFIDINLYKSLATNTIEYIQKGDLVGIKGHIQRYDNTYTANGHKIYKIVAKKVTFLSNRKEDDGE